MLRQALFAASLIACSTGICEPVETVSDPPREDARPLFAAPTERDRVGRIVAPVMINGQGPFNLLVDTGANSTTLSGALARRLGLAFSADSQIIVNGVTGRALMPAASIDRLQAGALVLTNQRVPVIESNVMANADGILGVAALTDKQLIVDFRYNRVTLGYSQKLPPYFITVKAKRLPSGLLVAPAMVGRVRTLAVIDTGAERTLGNRSLQTALKKAGRPITDVTVFGTTLDVSTGDLSAVQTIRMGEVRINNTHVAFGDFHVFDIWDLDDRPAIILGMDVIGRVDIFAIDFRRMEIGFRS
jgi:predicted aspartyl protease